MAKEDIMIKVDTSEAAAIYDKVLKELNFDYIEACDKTCSPMFNPEHVDKIDFVHALREFVGAANVLNLYKKALFRGKTADDVGLREPFPGSTLADSCPHIGALADLVHGTIGIATEAGELAEMLLAIVVNDKTADKVNAVEEIGDQMWYQSRVLKWAGVSFSQAQKINIDKLHGRHGETFSLIGDNARDLASERAKLEEALDAGEYVQMYGRANRPKIGSAFDEGS